MGVVDDLPDTPDDIDIDRVVWDPAYRSAIKQLLRKEPAGSRTKTGDQ